MKSRAEGIPDDQPGFPGPVAVEERFAILDVLRGFALFGILVMNLHGFSFMWALSPEQRAGFPTAHVDGALKMLQYVLFEGKFYSIFSLLFGIGFAVQLMRGARVGGSFLPTFRRRLLVLLAIGAVHMSLVWSGDILFLYAAMGFLLIPFRDRSDRALLTWAGGLLLLPVVLQALMALTDGRTNPGGPMLALATTAERMAGFDKETNFAAYVGSGGWRELLLFNLPGAFFRIGELLAMHRLPKVLAMFLIGLWVGRRMNLGALHQHRALLWRLLIAGSLVGAAANPLMAYLTVGGHAWKPTALGVAHASLYAIGVAPLGVAYAAGIALLWLRPGWKRVMMWLAPVGRMALTNYLLQTVFGIWMFCGVGLGLAGRVGHTYFIPIALVVFSIQVLISRWWLAHHHYGPVEWLWRCLTYGRRWPLRITRAPVAGLASP